MDATRIHQKEYSTTAGIAFLLGVGLGVLLLFLHGEPLEWQRILYYCAYNGILTTVLWLGNAMIAELVPISWVERPLQRLLVSLLLTVIYTVAALTVVYGLFNWATRGISPIQAIKSIEPEFFISVLLITFFLSTFLHSRAFLFHWKNTIVEAERLKQAHLSARFESLKNQVNPHFLFNSLNVLSGLVHKDADLADKFIRKLAEVYRYILDTQNLEVIPLSTELEALEAYIFLLRIRFGESLLVDIDLPAVDTKAVLPPLSLQMLVENAIKHNIVSRAQPLRVRILQTDEHYITVENNLLRKSNAPESNGIGLANLQERYRYCSDLPVRIEADNATFRVSIPVIELKRA